MQDELALTRQDLRHAQQQLLKEAAEQEPNQVLVKACEHLIHNLTAREERLMEEAHAMRLEARAPGEQLFQLACHAVVESWECCCLGAKCGRLGACSFECGKKCEPHELFTVRRKRKDLRLLSCLS